VTFTLAAAVAVGNTRAHTSRVARVGLAAFLTVLAAASFHCNADSTTPCGIGIAPGAPSSAAAVPIVELDPAPSRPVYAMSDVHGGYDRLAALLAAARVIDRIPLSPDRATWSAGDAVLVVLGDLIDKGPQPVEVIDLLRTLESSAPASGGVVIVLLGNHEAEFFADPNNSKASSKNGINKELAAEGIDCGQVASGRDPRGAWLRARPFGARVGRWFYSHAGNTKGRSLPALGRALTAALTGSDAFGDGEVIGADSILEARGWYADVSATRASASALGVEHFVFGHDPNALGPRGAIGIAENGLLVRVDCGMSPDVNDSAGCILGVRREGTEELAEELTSDGRVRPLFRTVRGP
jgi:hypothetical protein